jgi:uncharacterized phage protein (TIGR01671 family)
MTPEFRAYDLEDNDYLEDDATLFSIVADSSWDMLDPHDVVWEQYTGLKDKDGNKIFEGDIVRISVELNSEISGYAEVVFESGSFVIKGEIMKQILFDGVLYDSYSDWDDRLSLYDGACVVVGNVHENLDLLEAEE